MKMKNKIGLSMVVALLTTSAILAGGLEFTVINSSDSAIKKLQISQDKKKWENVDLGKGVAPGKQTTLEWTDAADGDDCETWVKALYADGSASDPAKFDFCEDGLELEFE